MATSAPNLAIGALSRRTGCPIETVRYYERIGLLPRPDRTAGGYRIYGEKAVRRLAFVLRARSLGFSLPEVKALLNLAEGRESSCAAARDLAAAHLAEIQGKIEDLRRMGRILAGMIETCADGRMSACPLIEELYRAPTGTLRSIGRRGKLRRRNESPPTRGGAKKTAEVKSN